MQNNSNNTNDFQQYVRGEQAKDPTVQIVRKEDLQPVNDIKCKHTSLRLDESVTDFDCMTCNNPDCGKSWLFPLGTWRNKLKKGENDGR